ncbi:hypothetical protein EV426DRAFT_352878 [Tirmania nivea]|nr:hypothetical protein EV426DRAFT_352878 [Tirmania nivea]
MASNSYHLTKEDVRKFESRTSRMHKNGSIPKGSTAAALQSIVDSRSPGPPHIEEVKATLPLPEDPHAAAPDLPFVEKSYDIRKTGVGVGGSVEEDPHVIDMRDPVVKESNVRIDPEEWHKEVYPTEKGV